MLPPLQQKLVNWVDGMKISKAHFQALENYFLETQQDIAALHLTDYNFGLLFEGTDQLRIESPYNILIDAEKVEVQRCRAITPAGARIEVLDGSHPHLRRALSDLVDIRNTAAQYLYAVITIDSQSRIPAGEPSAAESPFRFPQALPTYRLDIVPAEQLSSTQYAAYSLPIARINKNFNGYEVDPRYIPPCTRVSSISGLSNFFDQQGNLLKDLADNTLLEIMKIVREKRQQNQANHLSEDIGDLAYSIIQYCVGNIDEYRMILKEQAPIYSVLWFVKLARLVRNQYAHARNRDNLLKYLSNYAGMVGGQIEDSTDRLCNLKYNHLDIRSALDSIQQMTEFWNNLFNRLRGLSFVEFAQHRMIENVTHFSGGNTTPITTSPPSSTTRIKFTNKGGSNEQSKPPTGGGRLGEDLE